MKEILIATKNPGKFSEILEVLYGLPFKFLFLGDLDLEDMDFVEDGVTFEENAFKKAKYYFNKTGIFSVGEDSGLLVDALPGELGVFTRRWGAGEHANDQEWLDFFMNRMTEESERGAKFVCNACIYDGKERRHFEGETIGVIAEEVLGPVIKGIPLSAVFVPNGSECVYSLLESAEKAKISHRGKSLSKLRRYLEFFA